MTEDILVMRNICKSFGGVKALDQVDYNVKKGKVNILIGENGAGKSTLMRILTGAHLCDDGEIFLNGKRIEIRSPKDAIQNQIAMIYQELNLVQEMTVEQNIFLGREVSSKGILKKKELYEKTKKLMDIYDVHLDPNAIVSTLSVANQQMLEIIKALSMDAKILIMDEPTSSLTIPEVKHLFSIIRKLINKGITIIYISHRMDEIFEIGDYITVLRDGQNVAEYKLSEVTRDQIIKAMVGRQISNVCYKKEKTIGETVLKVDKLTKKGMFRDVSFELRKGEILGVSGLMGAGRTEMAMTLFGAIRADSGDIYLDGKKVVIDSPHKAIENKIAYLPEDRKKLGVDLNSKISTNIALTNLDKIAPRGFLNFTTERELSNKMVDKLMVRTPSIYQIVGNLSGGNQQKIVLAKWLARDLKILILDEPTRGVDVGAKDEIHKLIINLAQQGLAIILISSELPEILRLSDRILVMHEGTQKIIMDAEGATQEKIMSYAVS